MDPNSVTDYLKSKGMDTSLSARSELGKKYNIDYSSTNDKYATQNAALLKALKDAETSVGVGQVGGPQPSQLVGTSDASIQKKEEEAKRKLEEGLKKNEEIERLRQEVEMKTLRDQISGTATTPVKPELSKQFATLINEKDASGSSLQDYNARIIDLNTQKKEAVAQLASFRRGMTGVSEGFSQGTISREEQAVQDKVDFLNRQIDTLNLQAKNRNDVISSIMDFTKTDYTNAVNEYDKEFAKNLQLYNALSTKESKEATVENQLKDNARANLQVIYNQIQSGNLSYDELSDDKKIMIQSLEKQAGFPAGFSDFVKKNIKGDVLSISSRTSKDGSEYFDILTKNADGSISVNSIYRGQGKGTESGDETTKKIAEFRKELSSSVEKINARGTARSTPEKEFARLKIQFPDVDPDIIRSTLQNSLVKSPQP